MKTRLYLMILAGLLCLNGSAQDLKQYAKSINSKKLASHVKYLSSDDLQGRNTGSVGQKLAAQYIRDTFKDALLNNPLSEEDPYFQQFRLFRRKCISQLLYTNRDTLNSLTEYMIDNGKSEFEGNKSFNLVFVGFGLERDYTYVDVEGKVVIYFDGYPEYDSVESKNYLEVSDEKFVTAKERGAIGAIKIFEDNEFSRSYIEAIASYANERMRPGKPFASGLDSVIPNPIAILPSGAARLLGISFEILEKSRKNLDRDLAIPSHFENTIHLESVYENEQVRTENVMGYIQGNRKSDEWIIVSGHYDHLGARGGEIYPGANDNASGIAAMLEVINTLALMQESGFNPDRNILFIAFTGEEKGLLGSQYYVKHPIVPLEKTKFVINLDMLGRSDIKHKNEDNYVYIDLMDTVDSPLYKLCYSVKPLLNLDAITLEFAFRGKTFAMGRSDHMSFSDHNIPYIYYYNGTHTDWHQPEDTWEKINYTSLTDISRHLFGTLWKLSTDN